MIHLLLSLSIVNLIWVDFVSSAGSRDRLIESVAKCAPALLSQVLPVFPVMTLTVVVCFDLQNSTDRRFEIGTYSLQLVLGVLVLKHLNDMDLYNLTMIGRSILFDPRTQRPKSQSFLHSQHRCLNRSRWW